MFYSSCVLKYTHLQLTGFCQILFGSLGDEPKFFAVDSVWWVSKIARCDLGEQMGRFVHWPSGLFVTAYWKYKTNQASRSKPVRFCVRAELNGMETSKEVTAEPGPSCSARVPQGSRASSNALHSTQSRWTFPYEELCRPVPQQGNWAKLERSIRRFLWDPG